MFLSCVCDTNIVVAIQRVSLCVELLGVYRMDKIGLSVTIFDWEAMRVVPPK